MLDQAGERLKATNSLNWAAAWIMFKGKLDEGVAATEVALAYARKFHVRFFELMFPADLLAAALIRCNFAQFDSILNEAAGDSTFLDVVGSARAEMSGDTDAAVRMAPTPSAPGGVVPAFLCQLLGNLARTSFNAGLEDRARGHLADWTKGFSRLGPHHVVPRLSAIAELDECLPALGDESLIKPLYEYLDEWKILRYSSPEGRGLDHIRGALALRLERIDEAEAWYRAGLKWAERERCPVERGRCMQGLAEVAVRRRRNGEALRLLDEASVLFEAHGAKLYLDRAIAARDALLASGRGTKRPLLTAYPGSLSEREVEVLRLVASGRTNQQIADELFISLNTVARHVSNVFDKTGAANRADAASYAMRNGLAE